MTKAGLVKYLHTSHGSLTKQQASDAVEKILETLKAQLAQGERILVTNFGSFEIAERQERRGRNPTTGEIIRIHPKRTIVFRSSQRLEETLNTDGSP